MLLEGTTINAITFGSLAPVLVLVAVLQYLNRFTTRPHFQTWTAGWLFYALFLTSNLLPEDQFSPALLTVGRNWCLSTSALLILWGSFQFINVPVKQRLIAMMLLFNLVWSCATGSQFSNTPWLLFPAFSFLALASAFTAFCFFARRNNRVQKGTALLGFAFAFWSMFLLWKGFINMSGLENIAGYVGSGIIQLLIALSLTAQVLEETRGKLQDAVEKFSRELTRSSDLLSQTEMAWANYRLLFHNSKEPVVIAAEDDLRILELNPPAKKLFHLHGEFSGISLATYCSIPNLNNPDPARFLSRLPATSEIQLNLPDGSTVRAKVRSERIRHMGVDARQLIFAEIAERMNLAHQLRDGSKMSALGQVISGMAHELNNPLATIKGYSDLLLLTAPLDQPTRAALTKVASESNRAAALVRDLLAFARPETPRIVPLRLNELLHTLLATRRPDLERQLISLIFEPHPDDPMVLGSAEQLQQALANLIHNAAEALLETDGERAIRISSRVQDAKVQILVDDSGPGVPDELASRIFEPFFTTKPIGTGTGLGLSVCYSIMLHHKGRVFQQPGSLGGACFVLELPAPLPAQQPAAIATPNFRSRVAADQSAHILVVDDEPTVGSLVKDMLELLGHQVTVRTSPGDALTDLEQHHFDAVLSDFRMPGMNGRDFFRRAVGLHSAYARRFLFLTGDMMNAETHDFFQSEKVPCLLKPFQLSAIETALNELLCKERPLLVSVA